MINICVAWLGLHGGGWFIINSACALDSGSTFFGPNALIMDGQTLSAAMHVRGINIRYLGRVVQLLIEREKAAKESVSRVTPVNPVTVNGHSQPNQNGTSSNNGLANLPHYMTTIAVMELIARSAKHVFNPYVQVPTLILVYIYVGIHNINMFSLKQSVDVMSQSLAISHFLNCFLMSGQSSVPLNLNDEVKIHIDRV